LLDVVGENLEVGEGEVGACGRRRDDDTSGGGGYFEDVGSPGIGDDFGALGDGPGEVVEDFGSGGAFEADVGDLD